MIAVSGVRSENNSDKAFIELGKTQTRSMIYQLQLWYDA